MPLTEYNEFLFPSTLNISAPTTGKQVILRISDISDF